MFSISVVKSLTSYFNGINLIYILLHTFRTVVDFKVCNQWFANKGCNELHNSLTEQSQCVPAKINICKNVNDSLWERNSV